MRKKSHISLAGEILNSLDMEQLGNHKLSFYAGSILPDCIPTFLTTPHNFQKTFEKVKDKILKFIENYKVEKGLTKRNYIRLGEIIHYIADYFTFPHNSNYDGTIKEHCIYEGDLKIKLREYIKSGEARRDLKNLKDIEVKNTFEELVEFIKENHNEYLTKKSTVIEDCKYIVRICTQTFLSIINLIDTQFVKKVVIQIA